MSRIILVNDRDIDGFRCDRGKCIWLEADDVDLVIKEVRRWGEEATIMVRLRNGLEYRFRYKGTEENEIEAEFQRYIKEIAEHQTLKTKATFSIT